MNIIPESGLERLKFSIKESFEKAYNDASSTFNHSVKPRLEDMPILDKISDKMAITGSLIAVLSLVASIMPQQAIGLMGLGIAYLGIRMGESRNLRSMYALSCGFFTAQYLIAPEPAIAGAISSGVAMLRGSSLTIVSDKDTSLRNKIGLSFFALASSFIVYNAVDNNELTGLLLLPGLALSVSADIMGYNRSHTTRFLRGCAFVPLIAYDFLIAGNIGSGLASTILSHENYKTAKREGDFNFDNPKQYISYLKRPKIKLGK